jgi:two-component system, LytTR family, response regulator
VNCIILDDEPHAIEVLKRYVERTPSLELKGTFRNPIKALTFLQNESVQLIFLDVNMPNLNGIQFLRSIKKKPLIIFTTAYTDYAVESYEWDAVDYLVKPILFERFLKAVSKAIEQSTKVAPPPGLISSADNTIETVLLKSGTETHQVKLSDILFISKESNYLEVHTLHKKILVRGNMNEIFSWLPTSQFCRTHKSYIVNLKKVDTIESHQVKINKVAIPLGSSYREDFLSRLEGR